VENGLAQIGRGRAAWMTLQAGLDDVQRERMIAVIGQSAAGREVVDSPGVQFGQGGFQAGHGFDGEGLGERGVTLDERAGA